MTALNVPLRIQLVPKALRQDRGCSPSKAKPQGL